MTDKVIKAIDQEGGVGVKVTEDKEDTNVYIQKMVQEAAVLLYESAETTVVKNDGEADGTAGFNYTFDANDFNRFLFMFTTTDPDPATVEQPVFSQSININLLGPDDAFFGRYKFAGAADQKCRNADAYNITSKPCYAFVLGQQCLPIKKVNIQGTYNNTDTTTDIKVALKVYGITKAPYDYRFNQVNDWGTVGIEGVYGPGAA